MVNFFPCVKGLCWYYSPFEILRCFHNRILFLISCLALHIALDMHWNYFPMGEVLFRKIYSHLFGLLELIVQHCPAGFDDNTGDIVIIVIVVVLYDYFGICLLLVCVCLFVFSVSVRGKLNAKLSVDRLAKPAAVSTSECVNGVNLGEKFRVFWH